MVVESAEEVGAPQGRVRQRRGGDRAAVGPGSDRSGLQRLRSPTSSADSRFPYPADATTSAPNTVPAYLLPMPRPPFLARLGLDRPELRAWAMYDWAASAMQTTVMVAVFPIYFVKVAGAGPRRERGDPAARDGQHDRARHHRRPSRRCSAPCPTSAATKKWWTATFMVLGVAAVAGALLRPHAATSTSPPASSLSRSSASPAASCSTSRCCPTSPARSEIDRVSTRGLRDGLRRGRDSARAQPRLDPEARRGSACRRAGTHEAQATLPARLAFLSVAVWWLRLLAPALPAGARAARRGSSRTSARGESGPGRRSSGWARRSASCAATGRRF